MIRIFRALIAVLVLFVVVSCGTDETIPAGSGMVETTDMVISAETGGRLLKVYFSEGDRVAFSDTLVLIDTTSVALRLQQVRALRAMAQTGIASAEIGMDKAALDADLAKKEFNRIDQLIKTGSANQQQFDKTENAYKQSELAQKRAGTALMAAKSELARIDADIALLEKQLADCRPIAPSRGTVITKYIETGELVGVGQPLFKIAHLDTVWVKIYLPPEDLTDIKLGDAAEVDPEDGREQPMMGTVTWISSEAEFTPKNVQTRQARADLVYAVKVTIPNQDESLKIGMPVMVRIP